MKKNYLLLPGPVQVPLEVSVECLIPPIHHRSAEFIKIYQNMQDKLKKLFKTNNEIFCFSSSGTGGMEAAVVNTISPNDDVLVINSGKFGNRWDELARVFGAKVTSIDVTWGEAVEPEQIALELEKNPNIVAVFMTHCETSTGVINDVQSIGKIVAQYPAILVVDALTTIGAHPLYMDNWHIDIALTGSQKALMLPTGLSCIAISEKAWEKVKISKCPRYYWDFNKMHNSDGASFTPPIVLLRSLNKSLELIFNEGLEEVWKRHSVLAEAMRQAARAMGLEIFSKGNNCNILTAIRMPENIKASELVKHLNIKYSVTITNGQDHLKDKIIRVGHVGYISQFDIITAVVALERGLNDLGYEVELGTGVKAAQQVLMDAL